MTESNIALCKRFFDAIEAGSIETVKALYAPDAVIWHNTDRLDSTKAENLEVLAGFIKRIPDRLYTQRRVMELKNGFLQQHVLTGTRHDGVKLDLPACVICEVRNGQIVRLDEYFDSAAVAPWMV